jgi:energy-coupling factor transporter ATP-binding protein EcfA2
MSVIINKSNGAFSIILEYLNYKLPDSIPRSLKSIESCDQPVFEVYSRFFYYEGISFTINEEPVFKTEYEYFYKYSELVIEHESLEKIKSFIREARDYIQKNMHSQNKINIYTSTCCGRWDKSCDFKTRSIDTIYIPTKTKNDIIHDITVFNNPRTVKRYNELDINHSRIYMFYGPPGCGKTTFIKGLASYFKTHIAYLTISKNADDSDLKRCIKNIPKNSFFCLEDIDSLFVEKSRKSDGNNLSFSGFINILDGIDTLENNIIFMTTNNLESLEHALKRRINYFVKFTYATREQIEQMFRKFFPDYADQFETFANNISDTPITINILEKFFTKYLFDNIIEKSKLLPAFANGELKIETNNTEKLYI